MMTALDVSYSSGDRKLSNGDFFGDSSSAFLLRPRRRRKVTRGSPAVRGVLAAGADLAGGRWVGRAFLDEAGVRCVLDRLRGRALPLPFFGGRRGVAVVAEGEAACSNETSASSIPDSSTSSSSSRYSGSSGRGGHIGQFQLPSGRPSRGGSRQS